MKSYRSYNPKNKYSDFLTVFLIVVIIAIIALISFCVYQAMDRKKMVAQSSSAYDKFQESIKNITPTPENEVVEDEDSEEPVEEEKQENDLSDLFGVPEEQKPENPEEQSQEKPEKPQRPNKPNKPKPVKTNGYTIKGTVDIPKTKCHQPILERVTPKSLTLGVAILEIVGNDTMTESVEELNVPGTNALILGHNYRRSGIFFSDNYKLGIGDSIIITDEYGQKVSYKIYNMFYTDPSDASFMQRAIDPDVREITLQTCNDDSSQRLIIYAKDK